MELSTEKAVMSYFKSCAHHRGMNIGCAGYWTGVNVEISWEFSQTFYGNRREFSWYFVSEFRKSFSGDFDRDSVVLYGVFSGVSSGVSVCPPVGLNVGDNVVPGP